MRLPIRGKLILFIVAPILLIFLTVSGVTLVGLMKRLGNEAKLDAARLAAFYAAELDGRFDAVAQIAHSTAAHLEIAPDVPESRLYEMVRRNVGQHPLVFGAAIAFEPNAYHADRRLFSPYGCRDGEGGVRTLDIAQAYDYDSPESEWWWKPREERRALWTAPYFDEGAGNILMSTYSVPFHRDGEFRGVATIDIPLESLQEEAGLRDLPRDAFAIVGRDGEFVAHPDPARIMTDGLFDMAERYGQPMLADVARKMAAGERGVAEMPDWSGDRGKIWMYYAPIPATDWSFVAVVPETEALSFVRSLARSAVVGLALTLLLIVVTVVLVSNSLTGPIRRLRGAVRTVADGELDVESIEIRGNDEVADLGHSFNRMVENLRGHVKRIAEEVAARKAIEGELEAARRIQSSLLPRTFPPYPDRDDLDISASLTPAKSVAGDFFDFFFIDDNTFVFIVADVSGKGVPAALFMAVARTLIRNLTTVTRDPGEILARCGDMLYEDNPGNMFVTCFLGVYDTRTGEFSYASAGHPPAYILDAAGTVTEFGETTGGIVGIFGGAKFGTLRGKLAEGDRLVQYTDGVPEAASPDGTMLGDEGFVRILQEVADRDAKTICQHVAGKVAEYEQGNQSDDVTVLCLGRPANRAR